MFSMKIVFSNKGVKLACVKLFFLLKRFKKRARIVKLFFLLKRFKKRARMMYSRLSRTKKRTKKFLLRWKFRVTQLIRPETVKVKVKEIKQQSFFVNDEVYKPTKSILIICPTSFFESQDQFLGSTKDIKSLEEELKAYGNVTVIGVNRNDFVAKKSIKEFPEVLGKIKEAHTVFFSLPGSHLTLFRFIKKLNRQLVVRSHNPEFLHRLEYFRNKKKDKWLYFTLAIRGLIFDTYIKNFSQRILVQTDVEVSSYWVRLPRFKKTATINDYCYIPPLEIRNLRQEEDAEQNMSKKSFWKLGIIGTSGEKVGLSGLDDELYSVIPQISEEFKSFGHQFILVGNLGSELPKPLSSEYFENPIQILQELTCIIVPTKFGFGTKTKIVDALFWGQEVVVHKNIEKRLHSCLANRIIATDDWKINEELILAHKDKSKVPVELVTKRKLILDELLGSS